MTKFHYIVATFFYCGYFPKAPGTFTSFVTAIIAYFLFMLWGIAPVYLFFLFSVLFGFLSSGKVAGKENTKDPSIVVIDEVAGQLVPLLFLGNYSFSPLFTAVVSFVLFRFFDILKPFPVNKMENIKGGSGIMLDDIVAGIMATLIVLLISFLTGTVK